MTNWQAKRKKYWSRRTLVDGRLVAPAEAPHGRSATYTNWGCRCEPCTSAWTEAVRGRRFRRLAYLVEDADGFLVSTAPVKHGERSTYSNWHCQCRPCMNAAAEYARTHRSPKVRAVTP